MTIKQSTKYLLVYVLMIMILSAIVLYGVLLPMLVSAKSTLAVAFGIGVGVCAIPVYFYLFYTVISLFKEKEKKDEKGNGMSATQSDRSDNRMQ